jgi:hypothetical protein
VFRFSTLFLALTSIAVTTPGKELTQVQACKQFDSAIVMIDAYQYGSGFIVSPDGWILTAAHLVFNSETQKTVENIKVHLSDGSVVSATPIVPVEETRLHDFALLKVDKSNLPFLQIGDEGDDPVGAPIALIGFPLSTGIAMKFCLSGNIVAVAKASVGERNTQINIVFFQGVSIKGISGAPMISLGSGKVIGIENIRLTGIGKALEKSKKEAEAAVKSGGSVSILGVNITPTIYNLIDVLDQQLANGLGAGNGISAARLAIEKANKEHKK